MASKLRFIIFSGVLIMSPAWAFAQSAETVADARCVVVGIRATNARDNPSQQSAGTMLASYFIGRLEERILFIRLKLLLPDQVRHMTPADYATDAKRCAELLEETGQQIKRIGEIIDNRVH